MGLLPQGKLAPTSTVLPVPMKDERHRTHLNEFLYLFFDKVYLWFRV